MSSIVRSGRATPKHFQILRFGRRLCLARNRRRLRRRELPHCIEFLPERHQRHHHERHLTFHSCADSRQRQNAASALNRGIDLSARQHGTTGRERSGICSRMPVLRQASAFPRSRNTAVWPNSRRPAGEHSFPEEFEPTHFSSRTTEINSCFPGSRRCSSPLRSGCDED